MGGKTSKNNTDTTNGSYNKNKNLANKKSTAHRILINNNVTPVLYDITIEVNLSGNFLFNGDLKMHCVVEKDNVRSITLHSKELFIKSCFFTDEEGKSKIKMKKMTFDIKLSTVTFEFPEVLPEGKGIVEFEYIGTHNDQMAGFYRSSYTNRQDKKAVMVSTQFEALDARRCFPCIDEPGRKAKFKAALIIPDGLLALSNMPEESNSLRDDGVSRLVSFGETPKMSTYLLAFAVCEFDYVEDKTKNGVNVRVYTPPGSKNKGLFALDVATKTLDLFDDFFDIPYPLPKLDMIAVPEFAMGAMENWGLVTYREVDLLIDNANASSKQKQRVATVVAHELAHQWFGNLVTMEWWNGLWLNEGFATWMADYCLSTIFPDWMIWEQFIINGQATAMTLDALLSSHPIQVPIAHAEEVDQVFDAISYHKGASVVRLIYSYLGHDNFRNGLRKYMKTFKYSNTETSDLWQAWEDVSNLPIQKVMSSWTEQMGFPVVIVHEMKWDDDYSKCSLTLEQNWFLADGSTPKSNPLWSIPLLFTMGNNDKKLLNLGIMSSRTHKVIIENPSKEKTWIKLNGQQHIPMRVNYQPVLDQVSDQFHDAILSCKMEITDRTGLILDCFALSKAGMLDPGELVKLISAYKNESSMPVYDALEDVLGGIKRLLGASDSSKELHENFKEFGKKIITKAVVEAGWDAKDSDKHSSVLLRSCLLRLQASFMSDVPAIKKKSLERFNAYLEDPKKNEMKLPADIRTDVLKIVLSNATGREEFDNCMKLIDLTTDNQKKKEIYLALGYVKDIKLKQEILDWCTSGRHLKIQDFFYPIASVSSSNKEGLNLTFSYLQNNLDKIANLIKTASPSLMAAVITYSCSGFAEKEKANEIDKFFKQNSNYDVILASSRKIDQLVEKTHSNAKFLENLKSSNVFVEFIKNY